MHYGKIIICSAAVIENLISVNNYHDWPGIVLNFMHTIMDDEDSGLCHLFALTQPLFINLRAFDR